MSPIRVTREELHEMVWSRAVSRVAPELGISDVALRKRCHALHVPVPNASYWGRFHAGKPVERPPLPPAPMGVPVSTTFYPGCRIRSAAVEDALEGARSIALVPVPARRDRRITATLTALRQARQDENGGVKSGGPGLFPVRAHPATLDRVAHFLELLLATAQAHGFRLEDTPSGLVLAVDGEPVRMLVSQVIRRTRHEPTAEELARRERWDRRHRGDWDWLAGRPVIPYYDFTPTGVMSLEVGSSPRPAGVTGRFADSTARRIEERVPEILASTRAHAAYQLESRRVQEASRARAAEERARSLRAEEEARREEQRIDFLSSLLARRREHDELTALLALRDNEMTPFAAWAAKRLASVGAALEWSTIETEAAERSLFPESNCSSAT